MSLRRATQLFSRALRSDVSSTFASSATTSSAAGSAMGRAAPNLQSMRGMAGGGNTGAAHTHAGVTIREASWQHKVVGEAMAGLMWFWIFVRAYHDGDVFLYGHAIHFEHDHDDEEHDH